MALSLTPFSCPWDSGRIGAVLVRRDAAPSLEALQAIAEGVVECWNDYLSGNVWGWILEGPDGEQVEACWGYYGDPETSGCIADAKAAAKTYATRPDPAATINLQTCPC